MKHLLLAYFLLASVYLSDYNVLRHYGKLDCGILEVQVKDIPIDVRLFPEFSWRGPGKVDKIYIMKIKKGNVYHPVEVYIK